jgi:hypothetical protein
MLSVMRTKRGTMPTDRPERYAKQLASHWAKRGKQVEDGATTTLHFDNGQIVVLRPAEGRLDLEVSVPDDVDVDVDRWAQVVADHLQRFGQRDELHVSWD